MQTVPIYLASIALEPQRWSSRTPSFRVSLWCSSVREAGFDGIELWEHHYSLASPEEKTALEQICADGYSSNAAPAEEPGSGIPVFNTYLLPHINSLDEWRAVFSACGRLGSRAVKFNLGKDPEQEREYGDALAEILQIKPAGLTLLCECHPGSIVEQPDQAARFFADERFSEIGFMVHPFLIGNAKLRKWLDALGAGVMHVHTQMRDESNRMIPLSKRPQYIRDQLETLVESGFRGSISVEFVEGTKSEQDEPGYLFESAKADLATLRDALGNIAGVSGIESSR